MSKSETVELWAERLQRFDAARTTVTAFCGAEGVSQPSYYYWRRKLRGPATGVETETASPPATFLPVTLAGHAEPPDNPPRASATIELPGGIRIRVEVPTERLSDKPPEERS